LTSSGIDENALFEIDHWTLREWSQLNLQAKVSASQETSAHPIVPPIEETLPLVEITVRPADKLDDTSKCDWIDVLERQTLITTTLFHCYTATELNSCIGAIHRALDSGMILAHINYTACPVAMVHPDAQKRDEIFYI
jgi:hypothetical protein